MKIKFTLNGEKVEVDTSPNTTLLDMLRRQLGIKSVKRGCERGECGACTVLMDGKPVYSCLILAPKVDGREIITIEYLSKNGELHEIQKAFIEAGAVQCGFCTSAFILTAYSLLNQNPKPSRKEIVKALEGILCRCTGYVKIIDAIDRVIEQKYKVKQ
ncbi:MAG: (2Fe-2S)-binding protein [archaeon GB-1867-035]|nr:(2Fe-2S)-binding protein [Candidatus Culexmicrobium profundum]